MRSLILDNKIVYFGPPSGLRESASAMTMSQTSSSPNINAVVSANENAAQISEARKSVQTNDDDDDEESDADESRHRFIELESHRVGRLRSSIYAIYIRAFTVGWFVNFYQKATFLNSLDAHVSRLCCLYSDRLSDFRRPLKYLHGTMVDDKRRSDAR